MKATNDKRDNRMMRKTESNMTTITNTTTTKTVK